MKTQEITTTNIADFGSRERGILVDLLIAWGKQGLPEVFEENGVHPMMNRNSGHVFLINSEYQVAMMNGSKLEIWLTCSNCGHEGFEEDFTYYESGCNECGDC